MPTNSVSDVLKILGKLAPGQAYFVSFCTEWPVINSNPTTYFVAPPTLLETPQYSFANTVDSYNHVPSTNS